MDSVRAECILNVNDDEAGRYTVTRLLKQHGFNVLEASNGWDCVVLAQKEKPSLIILDINLPDISGYECCRILKTDVLTSKIPVLHLTAHALATENKVQSIREGADAYLTFPLEPSYLIATVQSLLRMSKAEEDRRFFLEKERTEKRKLVAALQELEQERFEKEQFVAALTHDLRSPLTSIRLSAQLLIRKVGVDPDVLSKQLAQIVGDADRADRMIRDLLDASLLRAGSRLPMHVHEFDLASLVDEVVAFFDAGHKRRFRRTGVTAPLMVTLDEGAVRRAIENLVSNALKYGASDSSVTLDLARKNADQVELGVHNYGPPIPIEQQKFLFEAYRRAPQARASGKRGWGLGLALVRGVVASHGGEVRVSSGAQGTTFTMTFPRFFSGSAGDLAVSAS